jgi:hypothetical protein
MKAFLQALSLYQISRDVKRKSLEIAKNFSWDKVVDKLKKLFKFNGEAHNRKRAYMDFIESFKLYKNSIWNLNKVLLYDK